MASIGRLFVEIGGDTKQLNEALQGAMKSAESAGIAVNKSGQQFVAAFQSALNPSIKLREQIELLTAAGATDAEIMAVMGDKIRSAAAATTANGQAIDPVTKKYAEMGKETSNLTATLQNFVQNPMQAMKTGLSDMLGKLGPTGIAIGAIGGAAIAAGAGIFKFVSGAADAMEKLDNLSAITGIATDDLQAYQQIAKNAGLESLDLGRTIAKLNQELGTPAAGEFEKNLKALGISTVDLNGKTKDAVTILDELGVVLRSIEDPAERSQVALAVLGTKQRDLIPLLLNSNKSLKDQGAELKQLGIAYDDLTKQKLREFDAMMDKVSTWWEIGKVKAMSFTAELGNVVTGFFKGGVAGVLYKDAVKGVTAATEEAVEGPMPDYVQLMKDAAAQEKASEEAAKKLKEEQEKLNKEFEACVKAVEKLGLQYRNVTSSYDAFYTATILVKGAIADLNKEIKKSDDELTEFSTTARGLPKDLSGAGDNTVAGALTAVNNKLGEFGSQAGNAKTAASSFGEVMKNQVSTILTDLSKALANNLIEWKGWADSLKSLAEAVVRMLIETLLNPIQKMLGNLFSGVMQFVTGGGTGGLSLGNIAGGIGGLGALFGGGAAAGAGIGAGVLTGIGGAPTLASLAAGGGSLLASLGSLMTNPWTIGIAGAIAGLYVLYKLLKDSPAEAFAEDFNRDFGKINISTKTVEQFAASLGLTQKQMDGIRKDLASSPLFLTEIAYPAAVAQGKVEEFLTSLEHVKTVMGEIDLRTPFEEFLRTGSADALNAAFIDLFEHSKALVAVMPDFADKLSAIDVVMDDVKKSADDLTESNREFEQSAEDVRKAATDTVQRLNEMTVAYNNAADAARLYADTVAEWTESGRTFLTTPPADRGLSDTSAYRPGLSIDDIVTNWDRMHGTPVYGSSRMGDQPPIVITNEVFLDGDKVADSIVTRVTDNRNGIAGRFNRALRNP